MPFEIVGNDITKMRVDAIVNSANPKPIVGLGTDSSIHEAAGPELLAARQKIGNIAPGIAARWARAAPVCLVPPTTTMPRATRYRT